MSLGIDRATKKSRVCFITADHPVKFQGTPVRKTVKKYLRTTQKQDFISKSTAVPCKLKHDDDKDDLGTKGQRRLGEFRYQEEGLWLSEPALIRSSSQLLIPFMDTSKNLPVFHTKRLWTTKTLLVTFFMIWGRCTPPKYLISLLNSKDAMLSYCCLPLLFKSLADKTSEAALELTSGRYEVLQRLNRRLKAPDLQCLDETIMCIKQQLFMDTYLGSAETVDKHIKGLSQIVALRGGLSNLGLDGELSHFLKVHVLLACVVMELPAPEIFIEYTTRSILYVDPISSLSTRFVESPIHWHSGHLSSLVGVQLCSPELHRSLCELRELTESLLYDSFVSPSENPAYLYIAQYCSRKFTLSNIDPKRIGDTRLEAIHESCRLAALIYATAIAYRIPIMAAASVAAANFDLPNMLGDLVLAIERTSFYRPALWGEMAGCFLWVAFVAGAASVKAAHFNFLKTDFEFDRLRIRLTAPAMFSMGLFHSSFANEAFESAHTMLRVQAKLALGSKQFVPIGVS